MEKSNRMFRDSSSDRKKIQNKLQLLSTASILNCLEDKELLNYRLTCRSIYDTTQRLLGLYKNPIQFVLGVSQYFSTKVEFKAAWQVYKKSVDCEKIFPLKPALLYKSNDCSPMRFIHYEFPDGENALQNGRIYQCMPVESYTWQHNAAWLLGNIHLGRPFLLTSPLIRKYIFREDMWYVYSAWTKEIVALSKAGYCITNINTRGFITLSPSLLNDANKKCNIRDLNADNNEIKKTLKKILDEVNQKNQPILSSNKCLIM